MCTTPDNHAVGYKTLSTRSARVLRSYPLGILEAMNENGLVLLQRVEEGNRPVFYPWRLIAWVYPKEEQGTEEEQKREAIRRPTEVPGSSYYRGAH
jgi:hypothetical protein